MSAAENAGGIMLAVGAVILDRSGRILNTLKRRWDELHHDTKRLFSLAGLAAGPVETGDRPGPE